MSTDEVEALYSSAVNYADAAQIVLASEATANRIGLILPTHTLVGLAIELSFKAIYLHRGGDQQKLRKVEFRHNLVALRDLAKVSGFTAQSPDIDQIISIIGDNYAAHEYRYLKPNSIVHFVKGAGVIPAVQQLIDEVATDVGLPVRPDVK